MDPGGGGSAVDAPIEDRRRWAVLAVLCLSVVLIGLSYTILYIAVPALMAELDASAGEVQWVVAAYSIVFAGLVVAAGSIGDRFGRRRILLLGLVLFGAMSALGAAASSVEQLIAARALMGVGAAMIMPGTLSTLAVVFPGEQERVKAVGIWAGVGGAGFVLGPLVAGVLVTHFWWGSTLLFNVPVVLVMLVAVLALVPESRDPGATPLDVPGAVLCTVSVAALVYVFVEAPVAGWLTFEILVAMAVFGVGAVAFVWWERRIDRPMLDVRLFRRASFTAPAVLITVGNLAVYGAQFLIPQYLQIVEDMAPLEVGLSISVTALTWSVFAFIAPRFVAAWGAKRVMVGGLLLVVVGLSVVATMGWLPDVVAVLVGLALVGTGMGLGTTPATSMLIGALPPEKAGVGSAMNDLTREVGGAVGVAVLGSVVAFWYRPEVAAVPDLSAVQTAEAQSSIDAALTLGRSLGDAGVALIDTAGDAFLDGIRLALVVAAVAVALTAVLVGVWLHPDRDRPAS
jgi:EmrB/QacA subfamily drug resistance transporter